ncbi:hypothetical protein ACNPQM_24110 [Streptomyces sp. NPDC056231]
MGRGPCGHGPSGLFDGRNLLDPQAMSKLGFTYLSVGRGTTAI